MFFTEKERVIFHFLLRILIPESRSRLEEYLSGNWIRIEEEEEVSKRKTTPQQLKKLIGFQAEKICREIRVKEERDLCGKCVQLLGRIEKSISASAIIKKERTRKSDSREKEKKNLLTRKK